MPQITQGLLPGTRGKDYHYVRYGGRIYVVYSTTIPGGRQILMSWRVDKDDYKALGIDPGKVNTVSQSGFNRLNHFGNAQEIAGGDPGEHPFQKYLRRLREINGNVSWLSDREVMGVMLSGYLEGWSDQEMLSAVQHTHWYQSKTEAQRNWELTMSKAERGASVETWTSRMTDALTDLYGPSISLEEAGVGDLSAMAKKIASGTFGSPADGFETWLNQERRRAEKIEGSLAWIERQKTIEEQRSFANRPEDAFERIRQDALQWLGPKAMPDTDVLRRWAERLVSGLSSEADWTQWVQNQAKSLYPFLGPSETWQDRASPYKRIVEENWGMPIGWDSPALGNIGQIGPDGKPTGAAMPFDEFTGQIRSQPQFWQGPVAREEGFNLFNFLNSTFQGVAS